MLREIISRCKTIKHCAGNFTQDFGLDCFFNYWFLFNKPNLLSEEGKKGILSMLKTNPDIFSNLSGMQSKKYNYDMLTYAKLHNIKDVQQLKERFPLKSNI